MEEHIICFYFVKLKSRWDRIEIQALDINYADLFSVMYTLSVFHDESLSGKTIWPEITFKLHT
jgi:hypothetical protein